MPPGVKSQPRVAIVTRTKNRNLMLRRALESVDAQTFTDYVHVVLNDGGDPVQLQAICDEYNREKRIVVHNEQSVGMVVALNQAITSVESEFVAILDDDDSWLPERLSRSIEQMEQNDAAVSVVKMTVVEEQVKNGTIHRIKEYLHPQSGEGEISLYKQCHQNYLSNGVVMYKRELYNRLAGYDETLPLAEDWDFGIRLMLECDAAFLREDEPLVFYHQRPSSANDEGNSSLARVDLQEQAINVVRNKYLRADLRRDILGVGYLMNSEESGTEMARRLEAHINYSVAPLAGSLDRIQARLDAMTSAPAL